MKTKAKIKKLKITGHLIGIKLPTNIDGHAGRELENILSDAGIKINKGQGPDIVDWGIEVKSRKKSATSPQTITSMSPTDIINTPYKDSNVFKKFQQQLRVKTNDDNVIVDAELYDFDKPQIQELIEEAYEHARKIITDNPAVGYTPYVGHWGYFEQTKENSGSYDFRVSDTMMKKLEAMTKSTFNQHFEVV
jgi:hypothetical protein